MVIDILLSVALAALTAYMGYMGVRVTLHPADTPELKTGYKRKFLVSTLAVILIVIAQGVRNGLSQRDSSKRIASLQADIKETRDQQAAETGQLTAALLSEADRRQQAEKDLAIIVQSTGQATRSGVLEDIKKSPIRVQGVQASIPEQTLLELGKFADSGQDIVQRFIDNGDGGQIARLEKEWTDQVSDFLKKMCVSPSLFSSEMFAAVHLWGVLPGAALKVAAIIRT